MDWKNIAAIVAKSAPLLGSALGPIGGIAGTLIATAFGVKPDDEQGLIAALSSPDAAIKLKQLELDHEKDLEAIELQFYQAEVQDKGSAREREGKYMAALGRPDYVMNAISIIVVLGFITCAIFSHFYELNKDFVTTLGAALMLVLSYYFGSSRGERE